MCVKGSYFLQTGFLRHVSTSVRENVTHRLTLLELFIVSRQRERESSHERERESAHDVTTVLVLK
jgi:hypothetical protein